MADMNTQVPVTVLTGYLGAGKTTLLNRILTENHGRKYAVVINEFGELGVDNDLVVDSDEEVFEMNNGCICCTVRGDLIRIVGGLMKRRDKFDGIIIETTGLANPAPVAQTFFVDDNVKARTRLDAIVTVVELFNIDEQTLNTQGLQVTTTIDPKAQQAAEKAVSKYLDGQDPDMRAAVVSVDPHRRRDTRLLRRFGRQRFRLRSGGAADWIVVQGVRPRRRARTRHRPGLPGRQLAADRRRHQDHQRRRRKLWHLQYRRGAQAVAEHRLLPADAEAQERAAGRRRRRAPSRRRDQLPRRRSHAVRGRQGRTAQQRDCAGPVSNSRRSTWPRRTPRWPHPASTTGRIWCRRSSTPTAKCFSTPATRTTAASSASTRRVADNVTAAMQPIAGYSTRPRPGRRPAVGGQDRHGAVGGHQRQQGRLDGRVHAVAVDGGVGGHRPGNVPLVTASGAEVYGSGLPSDIWKSTMDGALKGTSNETFPKPTEIGGYAGVPAPPPPPRPRRRRRPSSSPLSRWRRASPSRLGHRRRSPRAAPPPAGPPAAAAGGRRRRDLHRHRDRRSAAARHHLAAAAGRRPAQCRQPRLPKPHRLFGCRAGRCHRRTRGTARADRPCPADDAGAGDVPDRAGVLGARLVDEGGLPAEHRHRDGDQRVANWENQRAYYELCYSDTVPLYGAELLNQGKFPYKSQLGRERRQRHAADPLRRQARSALHGVSGADRGVSVRVDGGGQDLHRAEQAGRRFR